MIAFKRAKLNPSTKDSLHPEFIVEFADTSLFPPGFHKAESGYEFLSEEDFALEYAKNKERHAEFLDKKKALEQARIAEEDAVKTKFLAEQKQQERELEQFRKWKASNRKGK